MTKSFGCCNILHLIDVEFGVEDINSSYHQHTEEVLCRGFNTNTLLQNLFKLTVVLSFFFFVFFVVVFFF